MKLTITQDRPGGPYRWDLVCGPGPGQALNDQASSLGEAVEQAIRGRMLIDMATAGMTIQQAQNAPEASP